MNVASFIGALLVFIFAGLFLIGVGVILGVILGERRLAANKSRYEKLRNNWVQKRVISLGNKARKGQLRADVLDAKSDVLNKEIENLRSELN